MSDVGSTPLTAVDVLSKLSFCQALGRCCLADPVETGDASPPSELGEDASVEIHRPKPVHSWRELATEVGVIVIGITIALGGEQTLEWLHRRAEVSEARHALKLEVAINATAANYTIQQERCLSALVERYVAWAEGRDRALPPRLTIRSIGGFFSPRMSTWEAVRAGPAAHMPLKEREAYARFYHAVEMAGENGDLEIPFRQRVAAQVVRARATGVIDVGRLIEEGQQANSVGTIRSMNATDILNQAKAMGVVPEPMTVVRRKQLTVLCNAVGLAPAFE